MAQVIFALATFGWAVMTGIATYFLRDFVNGVRELRREIAAHEVRFAVIDTTLGIHSAHQGDV